MKGLTNFLTAMIIASWLSAIAIFSIQNISEVSLRFLVFESIKLPISVLLTFCLGGGVVAGTLVPVFWQSSPKSKRFTRNRLDETSDEFDF